MAEEEDSTILGRTDKYFSKISNWLSERIAAFVAFLFLLFGAGAAYGTFIVPSFGQYSVYLLAAPFGLAAVAYYNRGLAAILFIGLILVFAL